MKLRILAIALILVGAGSVGLVLVGPTIGASPGTQYLTSTVSTGTVSAQSVATGAVQAATVYGLRFGVNPDIVSSAGTTSGTGGTTNAAGSAGSASGSSIAWPVLTVPVKVGDRVSKGQVLATADAAAAQLALSSAQATLAAAQAKLATDQGGPDALTLAQARNSLSQSYGSYQQAVSNNQSTEAQNALTLQQAQAAVTTDQAQLTTDQAATPSDPATVAKDQAALAGAQQSLAATQLKVTQSNQQAAAGVTNASLSYQAASLAYQGKIAPASNATILADQATVATSQEAFNAAQAAVTDSTMIAPSDGLVVAVNILPGVNAPSSYAVEESVGPMVAIASFAEADITKLKVGQAASVTVSAVGTSVPGVLTAIVPAASGSSGNSSVVTYAVTVTLTTPPATVLAGMTAQITVITASVDNALRVPATALQGSAAGGYSVQVVDGSGSPTATAVQVGLITSSYVQITGGLSAGETVVTGTVSARSGITGTSGGGNITTLTGGGGFGGGFGGGRGVTP
jgi:multidrug efflux pump subunit AcrA (membrane-fusion protein)